jgi:crossover junction endodeoxyribonuclease RuvC
MRILTLDLSGSTGWSCGDSDGEPRYGTLTLPKTGDDVGRYLLAFDEWFRAMLAVEHPAVVVFEAPIYREGKTAIATARKLMGLASHTEYVCALLSVRCSETHIGTIKAFFAGHGRAEKADMMATARLYGWAPRNDHEADALGIWASAVHHYCPQHAARFRMGRMGAQPKSPVLFGERAAGVEV